MDHAEKECGRFWRVLTLRIDESVLTFMGCAALAAAVWKMHDVCQSYDVRDIRGDLGAQWAVGFHIIITAIALTFLGFACTLLAIGVHLDRRRPMSARVRCCYIAVWILWLVIASWLVFIYRPFYHG